MAARLAGSGRHHLHWYLVSVTCGRSALRMAGMHVPNTNGVSQPALLVSIFSQVDEKQV
jgi:hypothetical protein